MKLKAAGCWRSTLAVRRAGNQTQQWQVGVSSDPAPCLCLALLPGECLGGGSTGKPINLECGHPFRTKWEGRHISSWLLGGLVLQVGWDSCDPRECRWRQGNFCLPWKVPGGPCAHPSLSWSFYPAVWLCDSCFGNFPLNMSGLEPTGLRSSGFPGPGSLTSLRFPGSPSFPFIPGKYLWAPPLHFFFKPSMGVSFWLGEWS